MAHLTAKQARFVAEYLIDLNATQAAIRAGYSERTAQQMGSENLSKPVIADAIAVGQAKVSNKLEITAEKVLRDLEEARTSALATGEWGPAIRASELQGKHVGMFGDRVILTDERMVMSAPEQAADAADWSSKFGPH